MAYCKFCKQRIRDKNGVWVCDHTQAQALSGGYSYCSQSSFGHSPEDTPMPDLNSEQEIEREAMDLRSKYEAMERRALIAEEAVRELAKTWSTPADTFKASLRIAETSLIASGAIKPEKESSGG